MSQLFELQLPYQESGTTLFTKIAHLPWAVYLDSCNGFEHQGRYDILTAKPRALLRTVGTRTLIHEGNKKIISTVDPFLLIKNYLNKYPVQNSELPFTGGAIGYFGYDLVRLYEKIPKLAINDIDIPEMTVGIYDWALLTDHHLKETKLIYYVEDEKDPSELQEKLLALFKQPTLLNQQAFKLQAMLQANIDKEEYTFAFNKIKHYIHAGDCYQVNLAQRFSTRYSGSPWLAYQILRHKNSAQFAAYLNFPPYHILSLSPERFLQVKGGLIETKPIKGTRARDFVSSDLDRQAKDELFNAAKERAENLMIVDLLRNDLGKTCQIGSIKVPHLFNVESVNAVHHLVSTITGKLGSSYDNVDLLRSCFPGGSVTGAPKIRSMQIIEELEAYRRTIYCGAIGYLSYNGNMDTNITIRTLLATKDSVYCYVGGAITADSELESEYRECFDKIAIIKNVLDSFC